MVSFSYALDVISYILIMPIIGVFGDNYDKKKIILVGGTLCLLS
ncbi:Uncharacterised protein [Phocoenobacter uteri]|uniref:Uncharacterized protein n=1 Tax=Phocoenobacter uteri TaxID=146806 RepID=A0A379CBL5_9PAST|nr:Uncharacterised protein [Phocoenobacter uteri]